MRQEPETQAIKVKIDFYVSSQKRIAGLVKGARPKRERRILPASHLNKNET